MRSSHSGDGRDKNYFRPSLAWSPECVAAAWVCLSPNAGDAKIVYFTPDSTSGIHLYACLSTDKSQYYKRPLYTMLKQYGRNAITANAVVTGERALAQMVKDYGLTEGNPFATLPIIQLLSPVSKQVLAFPRASMTNMALLRRAVLDAISDRVEAGAGGKDLFWMITDYVSLPARSGGAFYTRRRQLGVDLCTLCGGTTPEVAALGPDIPPPPSPFTISAVFGWLRDACTGHDDEYRHLAFKFTITAWGSTCLPPHAPGTVTNYLRASVDRTVVTAPPVSELYGASTLSDLGSTYEERLRKAQRHTMYQGYVGEGVRDLVREAYRYREVVSKDPFTFPIDNTRLGASEPTGYSVFESFVPLITPKRGSSSAVIDSITQRNADRLAALNTIDPRQVRRFVWVHGDGDHFLMVQLNTKLVRAGASVEEIMLGLYIADSFWGTKIDDRGVGFYRIIARRIADFISTAQKYGRIMKFAPDFGLHQRNMFVPYQTAEQDRTDIDDGGVFSCGRYACLGMMRALSGSVPDVYGPFSIRSAVLNTLDAREPDFPYKPKGTTLGRFIVE